MTLKMVQLNLWKGKFFDQACDFLKKESPDIVFLQEVTSYQLNYYKDQTADLFVELKKRLGLFGIFDCVMKFKQFPDACFGNAILTKFPILKNEVVVLRDGGTYDYDFGHQGDFEKDRPYVPRHLLDAVLNVDGKSVHTICVHAAWTKPPTDAEETLRQADIIADYVKGLGDKPFIMGGDFNMPPDTQVIEKISAVANSLMAGLDVAQTLNPRVHLLGNKGFLVDYIFASKHFSKKSLDVPQVDISDHLPIIAKLDFVK